MLSGAGPAIVAPLLTTRGLSERERLALPAALALALALRLLHLAVVPPLPVYSDASGYDAAARRLVATGTLAFPVGAELWRDDVFDEGAWDTFLSRPSNAWTMPGYPVFVAGVYRVFGTGADRFRALRIVQALLATLTVALAFWIGRSAIGVEAGWIALALNALYPPNVWVSEYVMTEALFTALFLAQAALVLRAIRGGGLAIHALLGAVTVASALVRPVGAVIPAVLLGFEARRIRQAADRAGTTRRALVRLGVLGATFALLLGPWVVRNARVYGVFMPASSASQIPALQGELRLRGLAPPPALAAQFAQLEFRGYNDRAYARWAEETIRARLGKSGVAEVLALQVQRARMLAGALTTPYAFALLPVRAWSREFLLQAAVLALALAGLIALRRRPAALAFFAGVLALFLLPYWQVANLWARYLYPMMPLLLVLAAGGCAALARRAPAARPAPSASPRRARR